MRALTILLAALTCLSAVSQHASGPDPRAALTLYHQHLAAKCPDKHLEMLSPAALSDIDDAFLGDFSASQRRSVESSITRSCRGIDMGATCGNVGFLEATIRLHKLPAYVAHVCSTKQRCTDYSMCTDIR